MAEGFQLTSKIYLEGPVNLKETTNKVKTAFSGIEAPVKITLATGWKGDVKKTVKEEIIPITASLNLKKNWHTSIKKTVKEQTFDLNATISLQKSWDKSIRTTIKSKTFEVPAELKLTNFAKIEARLKKKQNIPLSPSIITADLTKVKERIKRSKVPIFVDPRLAGGSVKSIRDKLQKAKFPIRVDKIRLAPGVTKDFNDLLKTRKFYVPVHLRLAPGAFKAFQAAMAAKPITIPVNVVYGGSAKSQGANKAKNDIQDLAFGFEKFGKDAALAFKRFAAYTAATSGLFLLSRALKTGFGDAIEFQNQLVRLGQVSNKSVSDLRGINSEITKLATNFGVSAEELLDSSQILAQAGFSVNQTKDALDTLAKISLAPTFDGLDNAREGLIAIVSQFKEVKKSKRDVEEAFDAINAVSAAFAVESEDIIKAIRITGGVASATGASLKQFISIFTAIRSTTRESAESIATGLRTIITRLQRRQTLNALQQIGIDLTDTEGRFIGVYRAVDELGKRLGSLNPADVQFSQLAEELGGYRQIGKVLPLLQQTTLRQRALAIAERSAGSLADDQARSQESLARSLQKVKESFNAVIRDITQSSAFRTLLTQILDLTKSFIGLGSQLSKFLPALTAIAGVKIATSASPLLSGLSTGLFGGGLRPRTAAYDGKGLVSAGASQRRSRNAGISGGVTTAGVGLAFVAPLIPSIVDKAFGPLADESKKLTAGFALLTGAVLAFHGSIGGAFLRNTSFAGRGNRLGQSIGAAFGRDRMRYRPSTYYGYDSSGNRQLYLRNTTSTFRNSRVREAAMRNLGRAAPGIAGNAANIAGFGAGAYFTYRGASQQTQLDNDLEARTTRGLSREEYIRRYQQSQGNVGFGGGAGAGGFIAPGIGVGVATLTGNPLLGVLAALLTPVVTGLAGQFLNLRTAVSEATQQYNRVKFDEVGTRFNDFIESVLEGDTSARGRTRDVAAKVDSISVRRFQEQNEQDRLTLRRDIDNTVGQLSAFNDALIKSTDSLAEYLAEGGEEVLRSIANLDFQTSFDQLFKSVQEAFSAQDSAKAAQRNQELLNNALLEETIYIRNLNAAITDAAIKANQLGASFDNLVGIFDSAPSRVNFTGRPGFGALSDVQTISNLPQFQRAGEQTVGLLGGANGPSLAILKELTATAQLTRDLPNLLVEYANAAQATNDDLEQPAGYILSRLDKNLPESVRRAVVAGMESVVSSDTGDTPGIIEDIRSNPNKLSQRILGETGLNELSSIISNSSNAIAEQINRFNSAIVDATQREIAVRDEIVERLKSQLSQRLTLRELRKQDDLPGTLATIERGSIQQQRQFVSPELINRPDRILARLEDNFGEQRNLQSRLQDATDVPVIEKLNNGLSNLQYEADGLKKAFEVLISSTDKTTAIQKELQKAQLASNQVFDAVKNVAFGDRDTILGTERGALGALAIGQTRDVRSLPFQLRPDALRFLESFSEVRTAAFGPSSEAGQQFASGKEVIQDTVSNYLQGAFGLDKQSADEAAQKVATNRETQLIDKLDALFTTEQANRMAYEALIAKVPVAFKDEALAVFREFSAEIRRNLNEALDTRERARILGLKNREGDILGQRKEYESLRRVSADIIDKPSALEGLRFATQKRQVTSTINAAKTLRGLGTKRISDLFIEGAGRSTFGEGDAANESLGLGVNKVLGNIIASNPDVQGKFINPGQLREKIDAGIADLRAKRNAEAAAKSGLSIQDYLTSTFSGLGGAGRKSNVVAPEPVTSTDIAGIIQGVFKERSREEINAQSDELVRLNAQLAKLPEPIKNIVDAISLLPADQFDSVRRGIEGLSTSLSALDSQLRSIREQKQIRQDFNQPVQQSNPGRRTTSSVFRPRSTDTVPAMLSPEEYIVNAQSSRIYRDELDRINRGTFYAAEGGVTPGVAKLRRRNDLEKYGLDANTQRQLYLSREADRIRAENNGNLDIAKYEQAVRDNPVSKFQDLDARLAAVKTQQADTSAYANVAGAFGEGAGGSLPGRIITGVPAALDTIGGPGYSSAVGGILAAYKDVGVGTLYDLAGLALGDDVSQLGRNKQQAGLQALLSQGYNTDLSQLAANQTADLSGRFFQQNESLTNIAAQLSGANKDTKYDAAYQFGAAINRGAEDFVTQAPIDALVGGALGVVGKNIARYIPDYNFGSPVSYVGGKIGNATEAGFNKLYDTLGINRTSQQLPSQVPFTKQSTGIATITNDAIQDILSPKLFTDDVVPKSVPSQVTPVHRPSQPFVKPQLSASELRAQQFNSIVDDAISGPPRSIDDIFTPYRRPTNVLEKELEMRMIASESSLSYDEFLRRRTSINQSKQAARKQAKFQQAVDESLRLGPGYGQYQPGLGYVAEFNPYASRLTGKGISDSAIQNILGPATPYKIPKQGTLRYDLEQSMVLNSSSTDRFLRQPKKTISDRSIQRILGQGNVKGLSGQNTLTGELQRSYIQSTSSGSPAPLRKIRTNNSLTSMQPAELRAIEQRLQKAFDEVFFDDLNPSRQPRLPLEGYGFDDLMDKYGLTPYAQAGFPQLPNKAMEQITSLRKAIVSQQTNPYPILNAPNFEGMSSSIGQRAQRAKLTDRILNNRIVNKTLSKLKRQRKTDSVGTTASSAIAKSNVASFTEDEAYKMIMSADSANLGDLSPLERATIRAMQTRKSVPVYSFDELIAQDPTWATDIQGKRGLYYSGKAGGQKLIGLKHRLNDKSLTAAERKELYQILKHERGHAGGYSGQGRDQLAEIKSIQLNAIRKADKGLFIDAYLKEEELVRRLAKQSSIYDDPFGILLQKYQNHGAAKFEDIMNRKALKKMLGGGFSPNFHSGGKVTGKAGRDNININAEQGEFIVRRKAAKDIGHDKLHYMNQTGRLPEDDKPGYRFGGVVSREEQERKIDELVAQQRAKRNVGRVKKLVSPLVAPVSNFISRFTGPQESDLNEFLNGPTTTKRPRVQTERDIARRTEQERRQNLLTQQAQGRTYRSPLSPYRPGGSVLSEKERQEAVTNRARQSPKVYRSPYSPYNTQNRGSDAPAQKSGPLNSNKPVQGNAQNNPQQQQNVVNGSQAMNSLAAAMTTFNTEANKLANALNNFKGEITIGGQMEAMQVIVGGNVSVDEAIISRVEEAVNSEVKRLLSHIPGVKANAPAKAPLGKVQKGR